LGNPPLDPDQRQAATPKHHNRGRPLSSNIAAAFKNFIFTKMMIAELWSLSIDQLDNVCDCHNVLMILMEELRNRLNAATIELSLPRHSTAHLTKAERILEDKITGYMSRNPLESDELYNLLRSSDPVRNELEQFKRQIKAISRIRDESGAFELEDKKLSWKVIGLDHAEYFHGTFSDLCNFLLVSQDVGKKGIKRKSSTNLSRGKKPKKDGA